MLGTHPRPGDNHTDGVFARVAKDIASFYDWLSGPPMTDQDRLNREIAEAQNVKYMTFGGV